jgi:hypothetical protein
MDTTAVPLARIFDAADLATRRRPDDAARLRAGLADVDAAVRYWSALGLRLGGADAVRAAGAPLQALLADSHPAPRVAAADALARFGDEWQRREALAALLATADHRRDGHHAAMLALDVIVALGPFADPIRAQAATVTEPGKGVPAREQEYVGRLKKALAR